MRIAVISDIHGNLAALEAVTADLRLRAVDQVVNLGDSLSGPLLPKETADFLMAQAGWIHLAGNHERQILELNERSGYGDTYAHQQTTTEQKAWMAGLKPVLQLNAEVLLCHGTPASDSTTLLQVADRNATAQEIKDRLGQQTAVVIACGHSHVARSVRTAAGQLIVNPGSVGHPAYEYDYPYPHKIESGSPDARYAILEKTEHGWTASLINVPYAWQRMAELAALHGREDWVSALQSGYVNQVSH
ncbi:metallophosphoesterase family protein [Undibacterium sp. CY18W]|uniref:Metallophosphoesterase family protein n=1 Tax=Undibacterium hunanense TaxID=2762292 RepID=A0ABR6ZX51_9BURK|nr:metallophosphoesterase family protein [Undibacterium hunanense]MBC3920213.1 metallophosphoesterase family protein [Undibacterium hunanense]